MEVCWGVSQDLTNTGRFTAGSLYFYFIYLVFFFWSVFQNVYIFFSFFPKMLELKKNSLIFFFFSFYAFIHIFAISHSFIKLKRSLLRVLFTWFFFNIFQKKLFQCKNRKFNFSTNMRKNIFRQLANWHLNFLLLYYTTGTFSSSLKAIIYLYSYFRSTLLKNKIKLQQS